MTDAEFFDQSNLRASCRAHNLARGILGDDVGRPPASRAAREATSTRDPDDDWVVYRGEVTKR